MGKGYIIIKERGGEYNMEKKTLLQEIEIVQDKERQNEEKIVESGQDSFSQSLQTLKQKNANRSPIRAFSSNTFPEQEIEINEDEKEEIDYPDSFSEAISQEKNEDFQARSKDSSIIEKPNYDFIETLSDEQRKKIFKIDKNQPKDDANAKPKRNKFKTIIFSLLFAIFGIWGVVNIATLDSVGTEITTVSTEYNMNLISYLNNLHNLDATNAENMENLLDTIPTEPQSPTKIEEQSNWFDRFCNFIAGLFGG